MSPLWKPMPYYIMRDKKFLQSLKKNKVSQGISVLKLFIVICLKSDIDEEGKIGANLTYDDFAAMCSLSRKLINSGLRVLEEAKIIRTKGERKKRYILINCKPREKGRDLADFSTSHGFWCKMPYKGVVDDKSHIPSFEAMTNRGVNELNALKVYLYLLMIRSRGDVYISVKLSIICGKLTLSSQEVINAVGYLKAIGLVAKVDVGSNTMINNDDRFAIAFLVSGWESLEWKPNYLTDESWNKREQEVYERFKDSKDFF